MYIKKKYSAKDLAIWTIGDTILFLGIAMVPTCLYVLLDLRWLQLPWTPVALIGTAVAFLIGFQSNAAYGRIWEARKIWGGIVNDSRSWAVMVRDMVTNEYAKEHWPEEELGKHRSLLVHRHIAWMTALRYAMRQKRAWEANSEHQSNKEWEEKIGLLEKTIEQETALSPLLSPEDLTYVMSKTNKPAAILNLQSSHLKRLKESGHIWEFSFLELEGLVKSFFTLQGKSERIKNFPYPRQFATIGFDFVRLFILVLPFAVLPEFNSIGEALSTDYPVISKYFVWLTVPFSAMVSWVFNTMQRIGTVGENPFEGSVNDVPITTMSRGIEIDMREIMDEPKEQIPEPLADKNGFQM